MFLRKSDRVEKLAQVPLFKDFSKRELKSIDSHADEVRVEKGRTLARQDERGLEFILICEGKARVERNGKTIARLEDGDVFGEMSLIDNQPRSATVVSESAMVLLVVHRRAFAEMLKASPNLLKKVLSTLAERLREADNRIAARN